MSRAPPDRPRPSRPGPGRFLDLLFHLRDQGQGDARRDPGRLDVLHRSRLERDRHALPQSDLQRRRPCAALQHALRPGRQAGRPARDRDDRRHRWNTGSSITPLPTARRRRTRSGTTPSSGTIPSTSSASTWPTTRASTSSTRTSTTASPERCSSRATASRPTACRSSPSTTPGPGTPIRSRRSSCAMRRSGAELARTRTTAETSDEINCGKCHGQTINDQEIGSVLASSRRRPGDDLRRRRRPRALRRVPRQPRPRADRARARRTSIFPTPSTSSITIRPSPATTAIPGRRPWPTGARPTRTTDGNCTTCHGNLTTLAATIANGRVPWETEPKCVELPHLRGRGRHGDGPLPERHRPRRPVLPGLPRPGARPGPLRQGRGQLPGPSVPEQGPGSRQLPGLPQHARRAADYWASSTAHGGSAADVVHRLSHRADHDDESLAFPPPVPAPEPLTAGPIGRHPALRDMRSTYVLRNRTASSARRKTGMPALSRWSASGS